MRTFLIVSFCSLISVTGYSAVLAPSSGGITFQATASPGALAIRGQGETPTGKLEINEVADKLEVSGSLKIKMDTLKTGISLRDSHMKDKYLEAGKFPEALLVISKQSLPKQGPGPFVGELVLHGVKHQISGQAEIKRSEDGKRSVKATFPVKLLDHGITIPSFAGISVANEVGVETEMQLGVAN